MKHTIITLLVAVLSMAVPCLGDEPNNAINSDNGSLEARLIVLEKRLDIAERKLARLDLLHPAGTMVSPVSSPSGTAVPPISTSEEPNRDALRVERAEKQLKELRSAIAIAKPTLPQYPYTNPRLHGYSTEEDLKYFTETWVNLTKQEERYEKILALAKKNPELNIDVSKTQRELSECQQVKKQVEIDKDQIRKALEERHQAEIYNKNNQNNSTPMRRRN